MLEKMIRTQTAQKEKQLDDWMQRHDAAHPFPSETVELTPDPTLSMRRRNTQK